MKIKELLDKFKNAPLDTILAKDIEITARISYVPEEPLNGEYIILEDDSGKLEAATIRKKIFEFLKLQA